MVKHPDTRTTQGRRGKVMDNNSSNNISANNVPCHFLANETSEKDETSVDYKISW